MFLSVAPDDLGGDLKLQDGREVCIAPLDAAVRQRCGSAIAAAAYRNTRLTKSGGDDEKGNQETVVLGTEEAAQSVR